MQLELIISRPIMLTVYESKRVRRDHESKIRDATEIEKVYIGKHLIELVAELTSMMTLLLKMNKLRIRKSRRTTELKRILATVMIPSRAPRTDSDMARCMRLLQKVRDSTLVWSSANKQHSDWLQKSAGTTGRRMTAAYWWDYCSYDSWYITHHDTFELFDP